MARSTFDTQPFFPTPNELLSLPRRVSYRPASFLLGQQPPREVAGQLFVPSLASRPADIAVIAEYVLSRTDARLGRRRTTLRPDTRRALVARPFSENVRELRNLLLRGALAQTGAELRPEHLAAPGNEGYTLDSIRDHLRDTERRALEQALEASAWNVSQAARLMKLPRRTVVHRMQKLGIRRPPR